MRTRVNPKLITGAVVSLLVTALAVAGASGYLSSKGANSTGSQVAESVPDQQLKVFPDTTAVLSVLDLENLIAGYNAQQEAACIEFEMIEQCEGASRLAMQSTASDDLIVLKKLPSRWRIPQALMWARMCLPIIFLKEAGLH